VKAASKANQNMPDHLINEEPNFAISLTK